MPSHVFKQTLLNIKPFVSKNVKIAWASKGLNPQTGELLHQIVANVFSADTPAAVLSYLICPGGCRWLTHRSNYRSNPASLCRSVSADHAQPRFRTYTTNDIISVQVGGAVKNVLAIAAGIADGLGFGANTRAALVTRGIAEIIRLNSALGGQQETLMQPGWLRRFDSYLYR